MKITRFTGINNVLPAESLVPDPKTGAAALAEALNVDIGLAGEARRRAGHTQAVSGTYADVWEGVGFQLAVSAEHLYRIIDATPEDLGEVGAGRMWYVNFPDGRTAWGNSTANGIVGLATSTGWGVPTPDVTGVTAGTDTGGHLYAGDYLWAISYVRSDGVESAPGYGDKVTAAANDKFTLADLPLLSGHKIRIYLTHHNGEVLRRAGEVDDGVTTFEYTGTVEALQLECKTEQTDPAPVGGPLAFWRGHAIVLDGPVLWFSRHLDYEHFDLDKEFRLFAAPATMAQAVEAGLFVGTEQQLVFLRGQKLSELAFERATNTAVVLGSGISVPGFYLVRGNADAGQGECMVCIAGGFLVAGYQDGSSAALTERSYRTEATEVSAAFRVRDGIPQYLAIPR